MQVCVGVSTHCVRIGQVPGICQPAAEVIVGASPEQRVIVMTTSP